MTPSQLAYANSDLGLGHLLTQIDTYYQDLPAPVREAFDRLGATAKYGCHCDLEDGQEPDGCVLDEGRPQDCAYASASGIKAMCQYWRIIDLKF